MPEPSDILDLLDANIPWETQDANNAVIRALLPTSAEKTALDSGFCGPVAVTAPISNGGTSTAPNIGIIPATSSVPGSMSAADKAKLDGISGPLQLAGSLNCSANPNYPAATKGFAYPVTVAGKIGGASGIDVEVGDLVFAIADNAGGTQASVGAAWDIAQKNLVGALLAANNLAEVNPAVARANLGLGDSATKDVGTGSGDVAVGNDSRFPSSGEKSALSGTSGTPGSGNKYVTDGDGRNTDARTPTAHKSSHVSGGGDAFATTDLLEVIVKRLKESGGATLLMGAVADGEYLKRVGSAIVSGTPAGGGGSGDVVGPSSAVDSNLAAFDTTTGKLIKDSLVPLSNIQAGGNYYGVSTTPQTIAGLTDVAMTVTVGMNYVYGDIIRYEDASDPTNYFQGWVYQYLSSTMDIHVTSSGGSGTIASWKTSYRGRNATGTLKLDYTLAVDVVAASIGNGTWSDIIANQSFSLDQSNRPVLILVRGFVTIGGGGGNVGTRIELDSAGTPIDEPMGGDFTNNYGNGLAGSAGFYINSLASGAHTIKLQGTANFGGALAYCRPSTQPEFLRIQVIEF